MRAATLVSLADTRFFIPYPLPRLAHSRICIVEVTSLRVKAMNVLDMLSPAAEAPSPLEPECPPSPATSTASYSSVESASSGAATEAAKRGWVAPFLLHLHQMLRRENPRVIRWTSDGLAFEILDKDALTHQILPRYFKNKNFASFQRQLNYFGFRKWSKARSQLPTYSREHFTRDKYDDMALVKRQSKKSRKRKAGSSLVDGADEPSAKRTAVAATQTAQAYWISSDKCKPILPRPEAAAKADAVLEASHVPALWLPAPMAASEPLPVLSPTHPAATGFKLPSIRELPTMASAFAPIGVIRPRVFA